MSVPLNINNLNILYCSIRSNLINNYISRNKERVSYPNHYLICENQFSAQIFQSSLLSICIQIKIKIQQKLTNDNLTYVLCSKTTLQPTCTLK